jgi:hypothetical protein
VKAGKVGADDFAATGHAEADLAEVPRANVAAGPDCTRIADDFLFTWPDAAVGIEVTTVKEHSEGITAELAVSLGGRELHWGRLALASTPARGLLVKRLAQQHRALPWGTLVEQACRLTVREVRAGSPLVAVHPTPRSARQQNLIEGLTVPLHETSVAYGDGDSGKGWIGCLVAVALATGHAFPHIRPTQRGLRVAYLDWETTQEDFEARLDAIVRGAGLTLPPGLVYYRSLSRPLAAEAGALRADFARLGVQAAIIDSLIPASGEEPEGTAAAIGALNALRSFIGVTRFALSHVSKTSAEQLRGPLRPFGSVFMRNLVRSAWEIRRDEEAGPDELLLAAYHRKHNMGPKSPALSLSLRFAPDGALTVAPADLAAAPTLLSRASVSVQLEAALRAGASTSADLAARLAISKATVDRTLVRLAIKGTVIKLSTTKPFTWGLAAR